MMVAIENKPHRKRTPRRDVHSAEAAVRPILRTSATPHEVESHSAEEKYARWFTD